jgi:3-hydroxyisobutyrate dehydrogenase
LSALEVGFAGLGAMGAHMARNIHARGSLRAVFNRSPAKAEALAAELGVDASKSAQALAERCNVIVTCVTADSDVIGLCEAFARSARPGLVVVDTSTIAAPSAMRAAEILRAAGADLIDAPVSGRGRGRAPGHALGDGGRRGGHAGARDAGARVPGAARHPHGARRRGLEHQGREPGPDRRHRPGRVRGPGAGRGPGLEAERLLPTLQSGAAACWFLDKRGATMLRDEFSVAFKASLLLKDLGILERLAQDAGLHSSVHPAIARGLTPSSCAGPRRRRHLHPDPLKRPARGYGDLLYRRARAMCGASHGLMAVGRASAVVEERHG